jgi:hypothetical protein
MLLRPLPSSEDGHPWVVPQCNVTLEGVDDGVESTWAASKQQVTKIEKRKRAKYL